MAFRQITNKKRRIYSFAVEAFPTLIANIYIIEDGDRLTLVDTGSGMDKSNAGLIAGMQALQDKFSLKWGWADIDAILITHGHIDHFGGLGFLREHCDAPVGIHILDQWVLSNFEERVILAANRLERFLEKAGVKAEERTNLMQVYLWAKDRIASQPIDFNLAEGEPVPGDFAAWHTPGHCPGLVCIQVDDILLASDHILARTTPHQAPESITNHMGLDHYLSSLDKIAALDGFRLALGGHEEPISNVQGRIAEIRAFHQERLSKVLDICRQPRTIAGISKALFGKVESYHVLLALEEAGAHVEYLHQRGALTVANISEIEQNRRAAPQYLAQ